MRSTLASSSMASASTSSSSTAARSLRPVVAAVMSRSRCAAPSGTRIASSSTPSARFGGIRTRTARSNDVAASATAATVAPPGKTPPMPFVRLAGQEEMKLALLLNVIDPGIGGVLIMGDRGTGKSVAVSRELAIGKEKIERGRDGNRGRKKKKLQPYLSFFINPQPSTLQLTHSLPLAHPLF